MKKLRIILILIVAFNFICFLSTAQIQPPGISWKRSDRIADFPPNVTHSTTPIDEISEDWWYDHKNSYTDGVLDPDFF